MVVVSWYGTKPVSLMLAPEFHMGRHRIVSSQSKSISASLQPRWGFDRITNVLSDLLPTLHPAVMITHQIPFDQAPKASELIDEHPEEVVAVALIYEGGN